MNGEYFESAEVSDVGRKRKNNEDACLRIIDHGIFCVADGMGGQAGGDLASETIVTTLQEVFAKTSSEDDNTLAKRIAVFSAATNRASKWIKDFADEKVVGQMGSTIVALIIDPRDPRRAVGMHAGDSRLYRYRNGDLKQITADHSAVTALAAKLGIPPEKVPAKYQNELLRAVGLTAAVELEKTPVDVSTGDIFLICSDGLTKMMTDDTIAKTIKAGIPSGVQTTAQTLINMANEAGGKDNCTVILIKALDLSKAPRLAVPDDDDKTATPPADLLASIPAHTPVSAKEIPQAFDSDDIKGETPETPITKDLTQTQHADDQHTPAEKPSEKIADPITPAISEESQTHFITRKPPAKKSAPGEDIDREAPTPTGKFPFIIFIIAGALAIGGIWFAVKPKTKPPPPPVAVATPTANQNTVVSTPPPPSTSPSSPPPAASNPNQAQDVYKEAMQNANAAWSKGDFKGAISFATAALQKTPGDATATKLITDAQAQMKVEDSWRNAYVNARNDLAAGDYKNAVGWANEALKYMPGEKTATQLRDSAQQKLATQAADSQKYEAALRDGEAALKNDDLSTANAKAQEMLAMRPNDAKAQDIIKRSGQMMDYESAQQAFNQGDYDYALQICQNNSGADMFQHLASDCKTEQAALSNDRQLLDAGDYSFAAKLQGQAMARKTAFAKLLTQAAREQNVLNTLQSDKDAGNWQAAAKGLADPANADFINKPPFDAIDQWAKTSAGSQQNGAQLQQANMMFEEMLVWFNIKRPNDPYIQTPEARQQVRFDGQLDEKQKEQYMATLTQIQSVFASTGQLNQNNRAKLLKDLEETVQHHE